MARDVEFNVTANDKTGPALASAEAKFAATQKRIEDKQRQSQDRLTRDIDVAGSKVGKNLTSTLDGAFAAVKGPAIAAIAGIGVAASPVIGAAIAGAIIGGAGVGGVIGGVILAARDARVQAAGKALGQNLLGTLEQDAGVFVGPVLAAIDQIQAAFDGVDVNIRSIFANAAGYVQPLVAAVTGFLQPIIVGFDNLVAKAAPVITAIRVGFTEVGEAVGHVFDQLSDNGVEAAFALEIVFKGIATTIRIVGDVINALTETFGYLIRVAEKFGFITGDGAKRLAELRAATDATATSTSGLGSSFQSAAGDAAKYAADLEATQRATDAVYAANRSLYASTTSVGNAFATATAAAKKNHQTLDANTAAGRANREALSSLSESLNANYAAYVKVNGVGAGADALAGSLRARFIALATSMTGSAAKARDLANNLLGIPNVKPKVEVDQGPANVAAERIKAALASIQDRNVRVNVQLNDPANAFRAPKQAQLDRQDGQARFDANGTFAARSAGNAASLSRSVGPTQVAVNQTVRVDLDGTPFRAYTARAIQAETDRNAWRQKVGPR